MPAFSESSSLKNEERQARVGMPFSDVIDWVKNGKTDSLE